MPRRPKKVAPPPLDPILVSSFHALILNGNIDAVNHQLISTRRLGNAKDALGSTPLMKAVSVENPMWQTQVQLIDSLMHKGGASLSTRGPDRCHVLLLACKMGCAPEVIDCLCRWNSKRGVRDLQWNHYDENKDGALVLAARSGSFTLVSHLLSLDDLDTSDFCDANSNASVKVVDAAIKTGNEDLVMLILQHKKCKDNIEDIDIYDDDSSDSEDYGFGGTPTYVRVDDCVQEAYNCKMFKVVCEMSSLMNSDVSTQIWLCWRKSLSKLTAKRNADLFANLSIEEADETSPSIAIGVIAKKIQGDLVYKCNPTLLPLLVAKARHASQESVNPGSIVSTNSLALSILRMPDPIFRHMAGYCFILVPDKIQKKVESDRHFQRNAEWCGECEGYFLPYGCYCDVYSGYSS